MVDFIWVWTVCTQCTVSILKWNVIRWCDHRTVWIGLDPGRGFPVPFRLQCECEYGMHSNAYVYPVNLLWNAKRFVYYNSHYTTNKWDVSTKRKIEALLLCVRIQRQAGRQASKPHWLRLRPNWCFFPCFYYIILVGKFTCILSNNPICYATFVFISVPSPRLRSHRPSLQSVCSGRCRR